MSHNEKLRLLVKELIENNTDLSTKICNNTFIESETYYLETELDEDTVIEVINELHVFEQEDISEWEIHPRNKPEDELVIVITKCKWSNDYEPDRTEEM